MSHSQCCSSTRYPGGGIALILSCSLPNIPFPSSPPHSQPNCSSRSVTIPAPSCTSAYSPSLESSTPSGASSCHLPSAAHISNSYGPPTLFSNGIHPRIDYERVAIPCAQRAGVATVPFDTPNPRQHTGRFLATPNPGSPPTPRLRPASWGSPSHVDEAFESRWFTRSRSSAGFLEDSSGEEDLPFGRRTLPPLPIPYDLRRSDVRMTSNTSSAPSRDLSPDSGDPSAANPASTSFRTNYPEREYR